MKTAYYLIIFLFSIISVTAFATPHPRINDEHRANIAPQVHYAYHKKHYKKYKKTPPGWRHGVKRGWHGGSVPPGQRR